MNNDKRYTLKRFELTKHKVPKLLSDSELEIAEKLIHAVDNITQGEPRSFIGIDVKNDEVPSMLRTFNKLSNVASTRK